MTTTVLFATWLCVLDCVGGKFYVMAWSARLLTVPACLYEKSMVRANVGKGALARRGIDELQLLKHCSKRVWRTFEKLVCNGWQ